MSQANILEHVQQKHTFPPFDELDANQLAIKVNSLSVLHHLI